MSCLSPKFPTLKGPYLKNLSRFFFLSLSQKPPPDMTSNFFFFSEFFSHFTIFILISIFRSYLLSDKMTFERMFFSSHLFLTRPFFLLYLFSCFKNELNRNWWQNNFFPPPPPPPSIFYKVLVVWVFIVSNCWRFCSQS